MDVQKDFDDEYARVVALLPAFGAGLQSLIEQILEAEKIQFHRVEHRVKSSDSAERKMARKVTTEGESRSLETFTDMLGLRVITYFRDAVDDVAQLIEREFIIDEKNSIDKRAALDPDRFGYLSLHYVAQLSDSRIALREYQQYGGIRFEVQIRSILQHAWAEIEHDLGYKSEAAVPRDVRRRFSRLAGLLEIADDEFVALRGEVGLRQAAARKTIRRGALEIEVDQDSLSAFVLSSKQVADIDEFIATAMNGALRKRVDKEFMGREAARLVELGFQSIEELSNYLNKQLELLKKFVDHWFSRAEHTPRGRRTPVPAGITIYYVGMLRYAQDLLAGHEAGTAYPAISADRLRQALVSAMADIDPSARS